MTQAAESGWHCDCFEPLGCMCPMYVPHASCP